MKLKPYQVTMRVITIRGEWSCSVSCPTFYLMSINARDASLTAKLLINSTVQPLGTEIKTAGEVIEMTPDMLDVIPETYYGWGP